MSDFPREWASVTLGSLEDRDLLSIRNGFSCGDHSSDPSGLAHLRPFNVTEDCRLSFAQMKFIPRRSDIDQFIIRSGDVLYNNTNSEELVGKCAYWPGKPGIFVLSNHMTILRLNPASGLNPRFLTYYLFWFWRSGEARTICRRHVNQASIGIERLRQIDVPLPPIEVQDQIVRVLSNLQSSLELEHTIYDKLAALKSATMAKLFCEGLRGEPLKQTEIGEIPESWEVVRLGDIARVTTGTTPSTDEAEYYAGDVPFVKTAEIDGQVITETAVRISQRAVNDYRLKLYPPGTVLVAMYGQGRTRGRSAILGVTAATTQNTAAIECFERLVPTYLWHWLDSRYDDLRGMGNLGHLSHLNLGYIKDLWIPLPSIAEQDELATAIDLIRRRLQVAREKVRVLDQLFRVMLTSLMTGAIRIRDLDLAEVTHA